MLRLATSSGCTAAVAVARTTTAAVPAVRRVPLAAPASLCPVHGRSSAVPIRSLSHSAVLRFVKARDRGVPVVQITGQRAGRSNAHSDVACVAVEDELMEAATRETINEHQAQKRSAGKRSKTSVPPPPAPPVPTAALGEEADSARELEVAPDADADEWEEWRDMDKFESAEEEAEFRKWERILAEEEAKVDAEMAAEERDALEAAEAEEGEEAEEAVADEEDEIDEEEEEGEEKEEEEEEGEQEEELEEEEEEEPLPPSRRTVAASATSSASAASATLSTAAESSTASASAPNAAAAARRPSRDSVDRGRIEDGVRVRVLRVGGEQVMEISGLDEDEEGEAGEWHEDVVAADRQQAELEATSPDVLVGKGVGGIAFARKDILELSEKDLVESFSKGGGRGGQKMNKTSSCVNLMHIPTGTRVKCQFSRDLQANRARARTIMRERLEELLLGSQSRVAIKAAKERRRKDRNRRRRAKKAAEKAEQEDAEREEQEEEEEDDDEQPQQAAARNTSAATRRPAAEVRSLTKR